ncbi:MAG TPA: electron transport protein [Candidatus Binatia bacterium]|jgi:hypothetical protein
MKPFIPAILLIAALALAIYLIPFDYVYVPSDADALNPGSAQPVTYDLWGRTLSEAEARAISGPSSGALVRVDDAMVERGRAAFYGETFGDEVFLTDVLGVLDGPLTLYSFAKALVKLGGAGTTNLQVEVRRTVNVGGREFVKGSLVDTGLDVAKGAYAPLGMKIVKRGARIRVGMTCAVCHSTVDPETKKVVHGAPNTDLNAGMLLALATNSAAYFFHTDVGDVSKYVLPAGPQVLSADHTEIALADRGIFERAVDAALLAWPPGSFDSMVDFKAGPTQIPSTFTREAYPYGWSGFAAAGPFRGLSSLNNVHALNSDSLTDAYLAQSMFGFDPEFYIALVLQNAPRKKFRFDPKSGRKPSEFLRTVDPTPGAFGLNHTVELPHFPKGSILAPNGLLASIPGAKVWEDVDAIAAWENSLTPPPAGGAPRQIQSGRQVFERARCDECHQGPALTNHRVVPVTLIGTDPVRAQALARTEGTFAPPVLFGLNQPVPLPQKPVVLDVPTDGIDKGDLVRAFAWSGSGGGYKVPALVGLQWTAPYLHDGGVAVGKNAATEIGVPGTLLKGIAPDVANSLLALVDRTMRARVVSANQDDARLKRVSVRGVGHEFWVDADAGFSAKDQEDLIGYLLSAGAAQTPPKP